MDVREKLVELLKRTNAELQKQPGARMWGDFADHLIANGVTIQSDDIEKLSIGLGRLNALMMGHDKEFNERVAGYDPSAFCVGFEYAIQLAKGLLTLLPQPPKGE